jgi:hypothetical protein
VVGISVHVRDVETLDDLDNVTAPAPVEPGDVVASVDAIYRVEVVLWTPPDSRCVPVLARRVTLEVAASARMPSSA